MLNRFARFSLAISEIDRCWHKLAAEAMAEYDLNSPHAVYLTTLYNFPEGITAARLCEVCDKDKAAISRMMAELEEKGMVNRGDEKGNHYRMQLRLTALGEEAADHVERRAKLAVEEAGSGMTEEQRATLYAVLDLIAGNLQTICAEGLR